MRNSLPRYIDGLDMRKKYKAEEIFTMWQKGQLRNISSKGYVARANFDGTCEFVPFWNTTLYGQQATGQGKQFRIPDGTDLKAEVDAAYPMRRTTPQQKVERMMVRLVAELRASGKEVNAEDVRKLAAWYLERAEIENREADAKRVTREHPLA